MATGEWQAPTKYEFTTESERDQLVGDLRIEHVVDRIDEIASDLYELNHPDRVADVDFRNEFEKSIVEQGATYGTYVHYPWSDTLVHFPEAKEYYALRTSRNRNLITDQEQTTLHGKKIAVFGLSVGREVLESMAQAGIGNDYMLFDPDTLGISNLNRIRAAMADVGLKKTLIAGRKLSELDPFIAQSHFSEGYGDSSDELLRVSRPDLIVEETDNPVVKARIRRIAAELKVPLIMAGDVDERSTIDVERHDLGAVKPFNGKLSNQEFDAIIRGGMGDKDLEKVLIKILGIRNISPRLLESAMQRGHTLTGFPQLGTTATMGGALAATNAREIFLGRSIESGVRVNNPRKALGLSRVTPLKEAAGTVVDFVKWSRKKAKS